MKKMKKPIYKRIWFQAIVIFFIIGGIGSIFGDTSKGDTSKIKYGQSNNKVIDNVSDNEKNIGLDYSKEQIEKLYGIKNIEINDDIHVVRLPDDKSPDGKIDYKNIYNIHGEFNYADKNYHFSMMYSLKDKDHYTVIMLYSTFDKKKTINLPLKSDSTDTSSENTNKENTSHENIGKNTNN